MKAPWVVRFFLTYIKPFSDLCYSDAFIHPLETHLFLIGLSDCPCIPPPHLLSPNPTQKIKNRHQKTKCEFQGYFFSNLTPWMISFQLELGSTRARWAFPLKRAQNINHCKVQLGRHWHCFSRFVMVVPFFLTPKRWNGKNFHTKAFLCNHLQACLQNSYYPYSTVKRLFTLFLCYPVSSEIVKNRLAENRD